MFDLAFMFMRLILMNVHHSAMTKWTLRHRMKAMDSGHFNSQQVNPTTTLDWKWDVADYHSPNELHTQAV